MKRYLVFAGSNFYPNGGWRDFKAGFDTQDEASDFIMNLDGIDWWQIADAFREVIAKEGKRKS